MAHFTFTAGADHHWSNWFAIGKLSPSAKALWQATISKCSVRTAAEVKQKQPKWMVLAETGLWPLCSLAHSAAFTERTHTKHSIINSPHAHFNIPSVALLSVLWFTVTLCPWTAGRPKRLQQTLYGILVHFQYARIFFLLFIFPLFSSFVGLALFSVSHCRRRCCSAGKHPQQLQSWWWCWCKKKTLHCRFKCDKKHRMESGRERERLRPWHWQAMLVWPNSSTAHSL